MMGRRDPSADLRWALVALVNQLADESASTVTLSRSEARSLHEAARVAALPQDEHALAMRLLAAEDRATAWERRYRDALGQVHALRGTSEGVPDSTRYT